MVNVLCLAGGRGKRFRDAGFTFSKPLIEVFDNGEIKPMIQMVVENIAIKGRYIFLVLKEDCDKFSLKYILRLICKDNPCEIIEIEEFVTDGPAQAVISLAKNYINNDEEIVVINSDQWVDWVPDHFLKFLREKRAEGGIATFHSCHSRWSFAKVEETSGIITEVAEKQPISNVATCGIYYFSKGSLFIKAIEDMIAANDRTKGEFYICPCFNYLIKDGGKVYNYPVAQMVGCGTPEDLNYFNQFQQDRVKQNYD